jgi:hypothetical protein
MPAQQGLRLHWERVPALPRQHPTQRCKEQSIVRFEARAPDLAAKDRQFVPEQENLQLLRPIASGEEHHQLEQPAHDNVQR